MATKKKVPHIKTKKAEVSIQFHGRAMEITILLRPTLTKQLAFRLASQRRYPEPRKK
jgi:hypothetical protein